MPRSAPKIFTVTFLKMENETNRTENGKPTGYELDTTFGDDATGTKEQKSQEQTSVVVSASEKAKKQYYGELARKEKSKADMFSVLKFVIPIAISILIVMLGWYLYSVAEPLGAVKTDIQNLRDETNRRFDETNTKIKENKDDLNKEIDTLEDRVNHL